MQDWSSCTNCRLHRGRRNVVVLKQNIIHCPTKDYLPCRNQGNHIGIHRIVPLPPEKIGLASWALNAFLQNSKISTISSSQNNQSPPFLKHILVVGIAPGESEDLHGEPFYGISGNILNTMFAYSFSTFLATFTNTVCCRPFHNEETTQNVKLHGKNRDPEESEMELCRNHIEQLLLSYKFSGILTLGKIPDAHMKTFKHRLPTLHLFHPAYIARLDFKLHTIRDEAFKLSEWLKGLKT